MPELAFDLYATKYVEVPTEAEAEASSFVSMWKRFMSEMRMEWADKIYDGLIVIDPKLDYERIERRVYGSRPEFIILAEAHYFPKRPEPRYIYEYRAPRDPRQWVRLNNAGKHWQKG